MSQLTGQRPGMPIEIAMQKGALQKGASLGLLKMSYSLKPLNFTKSCISYMPTFSNMFCVFSKSEERRYCVAKKVETFTRIMPIMTRKEGAYLNFLFISTTVTELATYSNRI